VVVHSAGIQDRVGARAVLIRLFALLGTIKVVYADGGYSGKLIDWAQAMFGWCLTVVKRTEQHSFVVLPKRWIVERTFGWLNCSRRLSKDYEITTASSETREPLAKLFSKKSA
jgi:putative transposase